MKETEECERKSAIDINISSSPLQEKLIVRQMEEFSVSLPTFELEHLCLNYFRKPICLLSLIMNKSTSQPEVRFERKIKHEPIDPRVP